MMTKGEFLSSLKWQDGYPPPEKEDERDEYDSFSREKGPLVCKSKDGEVFVVGECNYQSGVCDDCRPYSRLDVVSYAYLWEVL